jgi:hypothetical protein
MQSNQNIIEKLITVSTKPNNIWLITATKYPAFFLMRWFWYLKTKQNVFYEFIEDINILNCSFLGEGRYYWLGNIDDYTLKKKHDIISYLLNYQGPHTVGLYLDTDFVQKIIKNKSNLIDLGLVDLQNLMAILPWIDQEFKNNSKKPVTFDQAIMLQEYNLLANDSINNLLIEWPIFETDESLFNLGKYFFKKDSKSFFSLLTKLQDNYGTQFYISYFSDQLFRAILYCHYRKNNMLDDAKTISYKLPYNLIQNDWEFLNIDYLKSKLVELYNIDFQIKNGGSIYLLDSWFLKYLNNQ